MVKYYNSMVVFEEIPNEITLAINITNCPCKCKGCHSKFLWEDIGTELTHEELNKLISKNDGITCVCFMGGDANPKYINELAEHVIMTTSDKIKTAWYSGKDEISNEINLNNFDYIKIGHYDDYFGGLNKKTTNQVLYKIYFDKDDKPMLDNITSMFWK
jgi:anaerobic ribonucleoside-triphosphate reductase activating protein